MKPLTKEFNVFKTQLNSLNITKGKILIDENDFQTPSPIESNYIDIEGYVFNHKYNKAVVNNVFSNEFELVRNEFKENLKLPKLDDFQEYIDSIVETYSHFEAKIIEEEDGTFSADFIKFENCDPAIINAHLVCNYSDFLEGLKHQLRNEIIYLHGFINTEVKPKPISIPKSVTNNKASLKYKSFELVYPGLLDKECFKEFTLSLLENKYISATDRNSIKRIFSGTQIKEPVVWTGDKGSLKYLVKQLRSKGIIRKNKAFWHTTSICFKFNNEEIKPENISTQNFPTKESSLAQLNLLISFLYNGNEEIKSKRERKI